MIQKEKRTINDCEVFLFFDTDQQAYLVASDAMSVFIENLQKAKQYEDAEEQGLLYRMPCKTKQIVYILDPDLCRRIHRPFKCEVDEFIIDGKSCFAVLNGCEHFYTMRRFRAVNIDNFGKTIFLTEEEAKTAFKAGQEDRQ